MHRLLTFLFALALVAAACGSDDGVQSGAAVLDSPAEGDDTTDTTDEGDTDAVDGEGDGDAATDDTDGSAAETTTTTIGGTDPTEPAPEPDPDPGDGEEPEVTIGAGIYPVGELAIDVTLPGGGTQAYTISCLGDTATLLGDFDTAAEAMCTRLADAAVQELLIDGFPVDQACTALFGSEHRAQLVGTLDGAAVDFSVGRNDGCGIDAWDRVLVDIVPSADA